MLYFKSLTRGAVAMYMFEDKIDYRLLLSSCGCLLVPNLLFKNFFIQNFLMMP